MPTSAYMPNVVVEIAFNAGFLTAAASRTWTDVSDYVELAEGISITVGRGDERSTADANQLTLTLDNRDGRFTPGKTTGAYYPNVKLDRPIRVTATPVDGGAQVEFLGFINEWPVEWEGTDGYSKVTVSASSRLARLGSVAQMKSIVETVFLADSPVAYYTLGEPDGATQANDSSGNRSDPLRVAGDPTLLPVVFGSAIGPGTDGLTAAQFQGGQYVSGAVPRIGSIEMFVLATASPAAEQVIFSWDDNRVVGTMTTTGRLKVYAGGALVDSPSTVIADGSTHHIFIDWHTGSSISAYVDGTLGDANLASVTTLVGAPLAIGGASAAVSFAPFVGVVAHVAAYDPSSTPASIANHATVGLTGFAGDTTSARLARYTGFAGVESAAISAETGQTTVQHVDTDGKQVVELMRLMETTEGGVLFDGRDGLTTFHNRAHRVTRASSFTLDMALHMVESDYSPKLDRTTILNDVTATDTSGRFTAYVFDATSKTDNGFSGISIETASQDDDEPLFLASWALYKYKTPLPRVATLAVDTLAQVGKTPNCSTVMAATVGDKITVSNRPTQDSTTTGTFFVEGYTRVYGPESVMTVFNVSPSSPDDQVLVIGDSTRGVIGTNPIAL